MYGVKVLNESIQRQGMPTVKSLLEWYVWTWELGMHVFSEWGSPTSNTVQYALPKSERVSVMWYIILMVSMLCSLKAVFPYLVLLFSKA